MFDDRMKLRTLEADGPIQQNVTEHLSMGLDFTSHDATPGTQELNFGSPWSCGWVSAVRQR